MTTPLSAPAAWLLAVVMTLGALALVIAEWRRADRWHRARRVAASLLAVGALGLLGARPAWRGTGEAARTEAALWTSSPPGAEVSGGVAELAGVAAGRRFALPGAGKVTGALTVPDAAFLRRRFPDVGTLHVFGDGLEAFDLDALRGLRVVFHPGKGPPVGRPEVRFLRCPRELPVGEGLEVQGRVGGLRADTAAALTLTGPDGTSEAAATTAPADENGEAAFALRGAPARAAGRFAWRLGLRAAGGENGPPAPAEETLGVAVIAPALPRVLILLSAPSFDAAHLRRWLGGAGGAVTVRTLVGQERYRFAAANGAPGEFAAVDARLLAGFDVALADGRALAALAPAERAALRAAVAETGLGVLVLADDLALGADRGGVPDAEFFLPWRLEAVGGGEPPGGGNEARLVRPEWAGMARAPAAAVAAEAFEIRPEAGQSVLLRDGQGRALAASARRGRGRVEITLVRETWRWRQEGEPGAFAAHWSHLLSEISRRQDGAGRWSLAGGEGGPVCVHEPVALRWSGEGLPKPGVVTAEGEGESAMLALAQDRAEPGRWGGTFWPRRAGWHRVGTGVGGEALDFYVHAAGEWSALRAARRRAATARFAAEAGAGREVAAGSGARFGAAGRPVSPGGLFGMFFLGVGYLWAERRLAGRGGG